MRKNNTAHQLLQLLGNGEFHSGEELGEKLGITRSAIWKAIQAIEKLGINVESVTGKGYRLPHGIELLNQTKIIKQLDKKNQNALDEIIILEQINSTNDYLMNLAKTNPKKHIACFAEQQTQGKGRRGRNWLSPFGTNIYLSLLWHFAKDPAEIMGLSLAVAISVINALQQYGIKDKQLGLKWPNDILFNERKLAGILLEMLAEPYGDCCLVLGIGLNTRMDQQLHKVIDQPWTSVAEITNTKVERNKLAGLLLNELISTIKLFSEKGLAAFLKTWRKWDLLNNKKITVHTATKKIHGIMDGISDKGELILLDNNDQRQLFLSGDVSVRKGV